VSTVFYLYDIGSSFQLGSSGGCERWWVVVVVAAGEWVVGLTMFRLLMAVDRDTRCHMQGKGHLRFMHELAHQHEHYFDSGR
jgi:hypothetical protein